MSLLGSTYGLIMEVDTSGEVVRSLHDPWGSVVSSASEVEDVDGVLYLGSYASHFIVKVTP